MAGSGLTFESLGTKHFNGFAEPAAIFRAQFSRLVGDGRYLPHARDVTQFADSELLRDEGAGLPFAVIARSGSDEAMGQMSQ